MTESQPGQNVNPLKKYYRQPKQFIRLPSGYKYYPEGAIEVSESGEIAVYPMTAKDELIFKTPDALLMVKPLLLLFKVVCLQLKMHGRCPV